MFCEPFFFSFEERNSGKAFLELSAKQNPVISFIASTRDIKIVKAFLLVEVLRLNLLKTECVDLGKMIRPSYFILLI